MIKIQLNRLVDIYYLPVYCTLLKSRKLDIIGLGRRIPEFEYKIYTSFYGATPESKAVGMVGFTKQGRSLIRFKDKVFSTNYFDDNPLDKVLILNLELPQIELPFFTAGKIYFQDILRMINKDGLIETIKYLELNKINRYIIDGETCINRPTIDRDPIEYYLIKLGLRRIDRVSYEDDEVNTETFEDAWRRYENIILMDL